jgi:hypothetical protein
MLTPIFADVSEQVGRGRSGQCPVVEVRTTSLLLVIKNCFMPGVCVCSEVKNPCE